MQESTQLWIETLTAIRDHGPITAADAFDKIRIADDRTQTTGLIGKFFRRNGFLDRISEEKPYRYILNSAGSAKLDELLSETSAVEPALKRSEKSLLKRVAELEPAEPWEFDPEQDPIVRDLATLRFSPDLPLYREGRERAGRLRYLAERLEGIATTEGNNIAADLRETADMLDKLTEVIA